MDPAIQAVLDQLQAEVQTLQASATAAAAAAVPLTGPPTQPATFAPAPALANTATTYLDLSSSMGEKHFKGATKPLSSKPFDFADPADLQFFLDLVLKKSQIWGWNTIFTIPVTDPATVTTSKRNLLREYCMIPRESVVTHVATHYAIPSKQAQDSFMACQCLLSSLTHHFMKLISADSNAYHVPLIAAADGPILSGPLFLKLTISQAHVDSRATLSFICKSLTQLDTKMVELHLDVKLFNFYGKAQIKNLSARGETCSDLLINLFKGYKATSDLNFLAFLRRKENSYEEGEDISARSLMADALKFKVRKLVGKCSAPSKEQGQILVLTAQLELLNKAAKQPKKGPDNSPCKPKTHDRDNKWARKDVLPKAGEPNTKEFDGKQYHVNCPYHPDQWVCHSAKECSKNPVAVTNAATPDDAASLAPNARRVKAAKLAAAVLTTKGNSGNESQGEDY
jgi:hypothetical protein